MKLIVTGLHMGALGLGIPVSAALVSLFPIYETIRRSRILEMYADEEWHVGYCPGTNNFECCAWLDE